MQLFERVLLPHLDAAFNLARWLTGSVQDAEDAVQEAYLRALRFFGGFRGGDGRAWLLAIVRNACWDTLKQRRSLDPADPFDETVHTPASADPDPEALLIRRAEEDMVREAVEGLPVEWREVLVLREFEGLSYKEIADVAAIPIGTVMSRLARARARLQQQLAARVNEERSGDL